MRTTLNLDDELLAEAARRVPSLTKTALIEEGLRALIRETARRRLTDAGGTMPDCSEPPRRKPA